MNTRPTGSKSLKRLTILILIGAMIVGLCFWWRSRELLHPIVDAPTPRIFSRQEIELGRSANAEIKRREGWSGKVILERIDGSTWHIWVDGGLVDNEGRRRVRLVDINRDTGKVTNYRDTDLQLDSARPEDAVPP
jgi:hypothetical protein